MNFAQKVEGSSRKEGTERTGETKKKKENETSRV